MGVVRRVIGAALVTGAAVMATATPAFAGTGDQAVTKDCTPPAWQSPATGAAHAKVTSCKIKWGRNILDGTFEQTVTVTWVDTMTDGDCADIIVSNPTHSSPEQQECNGSPKTYTVGYGYHNAWIKVELSHGLKDKVAKTSSAPGGF